MGTPSACPPMRGSSKQDPTCEPTDPAILRYLTAVPPQLHPGGASIGSTASVFPTHPCRILGSWEGRLLPREKDVS
jgi:hypothetical protein